MVLWFILVQAQYGNLGNMIGSVELHFDTWVTQTRVQQPEQEPDSLDWGLGVQEN